MTTIRVLQGVSVIALVTASAVLALCLGRPSQREIRTGDAPLTMAERFRQVLVPSGRQSSRDEDSALVKAAKGFALAINPPVPAQPSRDHPIPEKGTQNIARAVLSLAPEKSPAKFELRGISYHRSHPDQSMALIWEPGAGSRWVRQGEQIGHVVIERIDAAAIQCKEGERAVAMGLAGPKGTVAVAKVHEKKSTPTPKATAAHDSVSRPLLVRGMRQIPLTRLTVNTQQNATRESQLTAQ